MKHEETQRLVAAWRALWPTAPWRAEDMRLVLVTWTAVLGDSTYAEAEEVLVDYARSGAEYPPTPGQIAVGVIARREQANGTALPTTARALAEVRHYARNPTPPPDDWWTHPAVLAAVQAFAWNDLRTMNDTTRAHFIRIYEATADSMQTAQRTGGRHALPSRHTPALPSST